MWKCAIKSGPLPTRPYAIGRFFTGVMITKENIFLYFLGKLIPTTVYGKKMQAVCFFFPKLCIWVHGWNL